MGRGWEGDVGDRPPFTCTGIRCPVLHVTDVQIRLVQRMCLKHERAGWGGGVWEGMRAGPFGSAVGATKPGVEYEESGGSYPVAQQTGIHEDVGLLESSIYLHCFVSP